MPAPWELALAWLYVPATRTDRFAKAAAAADGVLIDLEDAVHAAEKARARNGPGRARGRSAGAAASAFVNVADAEALAQD